MPAPPLRAVAITGIGGFIGLRIAARARERGLAVRGLDVSEGAAARARALGCEVIVGDVTDPEAARALCQGADLALHTAAVVQEDGPLALFRRVNVGGTLNVARAAREASVKRFCHLSSVMVHGFRYPPHVTEDGPLRGEGNPYCITKIESEAALAALHAQGALETIVIRPGDVYGAGSVPWVTRPMAMIARGLFALIDGGRGTMNHVHVENLVDAIFAAVDRDVTGVPITVTDGGTTTFRTYFESLARIVGKPGLRSLPARVARPLFYAMERGAELLGREPIARAVAVDFVMRPHPYSITRARTLLDFRPRVSLEEGMEEIRREVAAAKAERAERLV